MATEKTTRIGRRPVGLVYGPWIAAVAGGTAAAALLARSNPQDLERWLGPIPPIVALPAAGATGYAMLRFLRARGFWDDGPERWKPGSFPVALAASVPFAIVAIVVDSVFRFGEDMNVDWPASLLFYSTIALVAEVVFHLVPLAVLVWLSRSQWEDRSIDTRSMALIGMVAVTEPLFQVLVDPSLALFVFPHVCVFAVAQLVLFRRYGYISMVALRLWYYLQWHIVWGALRIPILF